MGKEGSCEAKLVRERERERERKKKDTEENDAGAVFLYLRRQGMKNTVENETKDATSVRIKR